MTAYSKIAANVLHTEKQRPEQVKNRAGGYVFAVDNWQALDRFLIIGTEGNTYYATEREQTLENAAKVRECIAEDGQRVVRRIVEISDSGRAVKNEPAIFALALCAADKSEATRRDALAALPRVCRTGTHLFRWAQDVNQMRGWGPALRRAVANWYNEKPADRIAYQAVKYQQRDGWSHADLLALAHAKAPTEEHNALYRYIVAGMDGFTEYKHRPTVKVSEDSLPSIVHGFERAKGATSTKELVRLIREYKLPHECVPNEYKDKPEVWNAMLDGMGATAMIRNLSKMTSIGLLGKDSDATHRVCATISDPEVLGKGRVHPMQVLLAMSTYKSGHGFRGSNTWTPVSKVVDALDAAFYASFANVEPTGKHILLALDVSGSMGATINNTPLTCREAAAAMAMAVARSEKEYTVVGFTGGGYGYQRTWGGSGQVTDVPGCKQLDISPRRRLDDIVRDIGNLPFGPTDCAQPFLFASANKLKVDAVVSFTDNESWSGNIHPYVALEQYRRQSGIQTRFVACAFTATSYSVADSTDALSMNAVGLDGSLPTVINEFIRGGF